MTRRLLIALVALAWLPLAGAAAAQSLPARADDMALGRANAPVTVIEYASVTCPHCARWHADVFPEFKRRFIDTGRVRFVFRELPTAPAPVAIAGFMIARCAPADQYFGVIGDLMDEQQQIVQAPLERLTAIAGRHGLSRAQFEACLDSEANAAAVQERAEAAIDAGVQGTPTFFVNGRQVASGEAPLATLEAAIVAAER